MAHSPDKKNKRMLGTPVVMPTDLSLIHTGSSPSPMKGLSASTLIAHDSDQTKSKPNSSLAKYFNSNQGSDEEGRKSSSAPSNDHNMKSSNTGNSPLMPGFNDNNFEIKTDYGGDGRFKLRETSMMQTEIFTSSEHSHEPQRMLKDADSPISQQDNGKHSKTIVSVG